MDLRYTPQDLQLGTKVSFVIKPEKLGIITGICFRSQTEFIFMVSLINSSDNLQESWVRPYELKKCK